MKRHLLIAVLCLLGLGLAAPISAVQTVTLDNASRGVTVTDLDRDGVRLELNIGELQFNEVATSQGDFTLVSFEGCARSHQIGEPNLPTLNRLLAIPYGAELKVDVLSSEVEEISLTGLGITNLILPVQPSISKSQDPASVPFEFNRTIYARPGFYSLPQAQANVQGTMRATTLGLLSISPIEYNPQENIIRVYKSITVQVTYVNADWGATDDMYRRFASPVFDPVLDQVSNYRQFSAAQKRDDLTTYPIKYLIISDRMFEAQLAPFVQWKIKKGFTVQVAYTDSIGYTTNEIKAFIQSVYESGTPEDPAPSFVLFVGDDQQIPAHSYGSHISDLYFCEFTGDNFPEIYYGRFSAQNPGQLQPQIDKTLEYEQYLMPDPSYLAGAILIAGVDATYAPTYGNGQINYGSTYYFNAAHGITPNVWLYPASNGPVEGDIIQTINDGVSLYNYTAHGSHDGEYDPTFETSNLPGLTNYHKYLLGIGNCCLTNTFGDDYSTPCFGEALVQLEDRGGIGYIGGTNSTYWDEDYWWGVGYGPVVAAGPTYEQTSQGAYDGVFHDHGEPMIRHYVANDAIIFAGNMAVTESGSSRIAYYWQIYTLMGDPSVMTYLGVPAVNNVTYPSTILLTATSVTVTADPESYVGISKDGVLYGAAFVDSSGTVDVPIQAVGAPGAIDIVVTAQNRQPVISTIMVIAPEGPYCIYESSQINEVTGNGNGVVDAGESFLMGITLKNVGPDDAVDVNAILSTADTFVTITDNSEYYGTIAGDNGTGFVPDGFAFSVDGATPDNHNVICTLTVSGTNRDTWVGAFTVRVHAPDVQYAQVTINDAGGNSNGILDPGETANFVVTLSNFGSGQALDVSGVLSESDSYTSISDDFGYFGLIDSISGVADNGGDVYTVSADAACPTGYSVTFNLVLSGANGYSVTLPFEVVVGDRVAFYTDDFSYDQGWSGLGGSAEWTIGAATGGTGDDSHGGPDPAFDHTPTADNGVLGNDLTSGTGGDYNGSIGSTQWVTSPIIDCSDFTGVQLTYYHWLGVESPDYDHALLQVYDGSSWVTLFENAATTDEQAWTESSYDLSAYADENPDFRIRFGLGPTDPSWNFCGWNIDDIQLKGYDQSGGGTPVLSFLSTAVADSMLGGESAEETVRVYNTGDGNLRIRFSPTVSWLSCSTDQNYIPPGDSLDFAFSIASGELAPGDHAGTLHFTSNDYLTQSGDITVNLYLYPPGLAFDRSGLVDSLISGDSSAVNLRVYNTGIGNLHISFAASTAWLHCPPDEQLVGPEDSLDLPVTFTCGGLAPGEYGGSLTYTSDDPDNADGELPVSLYIYAPICEIPTDPIEGAMQPGDTGVTSLVITNSGPGRLSYSIGCQAFDNPKRDRPAVVTAATVTPAEPLGYRPAGDDKGDPAAPFFAAVGKSHGGPDTYGYSWIDSDDPGGPAFSWVDITATGTAVSLGDDASAGPVDIGFTFPCYDQQYSQVYIGSNGIITFGAGSSARINTGLPDSAAPNAMLAPWWDDLNPAGAATIYYYYDAAGGRFIVSFENMPNYQYPNGTGSLSFEAILYPSGKITFQYATMDAGSDVEGLTGATVGIENADGSDGLQVTYNAAYMHDNMAIDFALVRWLWVTPAGGLVEPYDADTVAVHFDARDLEAGSYAGQLSIATNDPQMPAVTVPISLVLESFVCGDVDGDGGNPVVSDLTYLVAFLFKNGPPPPVLAAADCDGMGGDSINVGDLTWLVAYFFRDGPAPLCH